MTAEAPFIVNRWHRHGHDRLYVSDAEGNKVGYRDLRSGLDHPLVESDRNLLKSLADAWCAHRGPSVGRSPAPPPADPETVAWTDLSDRRPGHYVLAQADARAAAGEDVRSWRLGAAGEAVVADELVRAWRRDPAWTALHALPVGKRGADVDHLVLGPGGVFTVNSKNHRHADIWVGGENLWVNGAPTNHVRSSRFEATRVSRILSGAVGLPVPVTGLIVVVNAHKITVRSAPDPGVVVLHVRDLARWLTRLPARLDQAVLNQVWDISRRSTTWQS